MQNLLKAVLGKNKADPKVREEVQRLAEQAEEKKKALAMLEELENMTDEDIERDVEEMEKMSHKEMLQAMGMTEEEWQKSQRRSLLHIGWCNILSKWNIERSNDRVYHVGGFTPKFSFSQVIDIMKMAYRMGQDDAKIGVDEYNRLWKLNRLDIDVTEEKVETPKFKKGDILHHKAEVETIEILDIDKDYYAEVGWANVPQHLPFEYVERNYD